MTSVVHQNLRAGGRATGIFKDLVSRPSGAIGLSLVIFHVALALISPFIIPFDYKLQNSALMLSQPDAVHWLGSDHLGRDVFSRTLMGGREALLVTGVALSLIHI